MNIDTADSIKAKKAQILGIVTVNASPQYCGLYNVSQLFFFQLVATSDV